ncbi:MAG: 16S rRNA (guanine(527)-N(7))-methyltransferase RsmG [Leptolyngbya sp. PLA1]|nr:16S rRNA (guanine(527)-N(7))-methyltransferase RsmG [Leptolyngbya sp. PLA1]
MAPNAPRPPLDFQLARAQPLAPPAEFMEQAGALGLEFEPGDTDRLGRFLAMLLAANELANLTAITDPAKGWERHILDSLTLVAVLAELPEGASVIDVGSGGGLPGIPLAIACPSLQFTLLEPTGKKAAFLHQAIVALGLQNCRVLQARAEAAGQDRGVKSGAGREGGHRERYDAVVSRAVGPIPVLAELTVPFAKAPAGGGPGGLIALIKGQRAAAELEEAAPALRMLRAVHETTMETPTGRVVVLSKVGPTPRDYPRRDGEPSRAPLGAGSASGGNGR